jgi:hypothetical protein
MKLAKSCKYKPAACNQRCFSSRMVESFLQTFRRRTDVSRDGGLASLRGWRNGHPMMGFDRKVEQSCERSHRAIASGFSSIDELTVPSTQIRCRMTLILRATATTARRWPRLLAICTAQAFRLDHFGTRVSSVWAASYSIARII